MPLTVKHTKQSGLPADDGDTGHVRPVDWYADHTVTGDASGGLTYLHQAATSGGTIGTDTLTDIAGATVTLTTGTWLVWAELYMSGDSNYLFAEIDTGSSGSGTAIAFANNRPGAFGGSVSVPPKPYVVSGSTQAIHLRGQTPNGSQTVSTGLGTYIAALRIDSGVGSASVYAKAYHNTTQGSLAAATINALSLNSEDSDVYGFHDISTNNSRMTVPPGFGGRYLVIGKSLVNQAFGIYIRVNGSTLLRGGEHAPATLSTEVTNVVDLADGQYVELVEYHDSGTGIAGDASVNHIRTELTLVLLNGSGSTRPTLLLDHAYGSDDSGISLATGSSWTDLSANETFTKVSSGSLIRIAAKVSAQANESSGGDDQVNIRLLIDSAGTPIPIMVAASMTNTAMNADFWSVAGSTSEVISGLAAGAHTIKWQANATGGSPVASFYLRPSAGSPSEFVKCQVIEEG